MPLEINLIDVALVSILIFLIISLVRPSIRSRSVPALEGYQSQPSKHPQSLVHKKYTPTELAEYDGKQPGGQGRLLLAIQRRMKAKDETAERGWTEVRLERTVFDVSAGRGFYGPGEPSPNSQHFRSYTHALPHSLTFAQTVRTGILPEEMLLEAWPSNRSIKTC
jgi:hypothetical protein